MSTIDDDWNEWLRRWKPETFGGIDSEFCSCQIPDVQNLSLFRPYFVCNSCHKTIEDEKAYRK